MADFNDEMYQVVRNISTAGVSFINMFLQALMKSTTSLEGQQSLKLLQEHLKVGQLCTMAIKKEDFVEMQKYLQENGVVYAAAEDADAPSSIRIIFRDGDANRVSQCVKSFQIAHGLLHEVQVKDFLTANVDKDINFFKNLNRVELEVFRCHAQQNGLTFAVQALGDGKYSVLYNKESQEIAEKVFKRTNWDLTGSKAPAIVEKINKMIKDRDEIDDAIFSGRGIKYIIDKDAKTCVIIERDKATVCKLVTKSKDDLVPAGTDWCDKDGNKVLNLNRGLVAVPIKTIERNQVDFYDNMLDQLDRMRNPTLVSQKDFEFSDKELKNLINEKNTIYPSGYSAFDGRAEVRSLTNLTTDEIRFVMEKAKEKGIEFYAAGKDIAYFAPDEEKVRDIVKEMRKELHKDKDERDLLADEFRYQNKVEVHKALAAKEKMYLIDAKEPERVIIITNDEAIIKTKDKEIVIQSTDPDFSETIRSIGGAMAVPVALTDEEVNSPDRNKIIKEHLKSTDEKILAEQELVKQDASRFALFEYAFDFKDNFEYKETITNDKGEQQPNPLGLSEEEIVIVNSDPHIQAAASKCRNCEAGTYEVHRSVLEELIRDAQGDKVYERETREEREEREYR